MGCLADVKSITEAVRAATFSLGAIFTNLVGALDKGSSRTFDIFDLPGSNGIIRDFAG